MPSEIARSGTYGASMPGHPNNWSFVGELVAGRSQPLPRGKLAGGSSAINGTYFVRGRPEDRQDRVPSVQCVALASSSRRASAGQTLTALRAPSSSHGGSGVCGNAGKPFASSRMISGATAEQSP